MESKIHNLGVQLEHLQETIQQLIELQNQRLHYFVNETECLIFHFNVSWLVFFSEY